MTDRETIKLPGGAYFRRRSLSSPWFSLYQASGLVAPSSWYEDEARAFVAALHQPGAVAGLLADACAAIELLLNHSGIADVYGGDKDAEDHDAERNARVVRDRIREAIASRSTTQDGASGAGVSGGVPAGFVLVPEAPTEAMHDAGNLRVPGERLEDIASTAAAVWSAMLAARPKPPAVLAAGESIPTDTQIIEAIRCHTSPTVGAGDIHGGVPGMILYRDHEKFVVAGLRKLFAAPADGGAAVDVERDPFEEAYEAMCAAHSTAVDMLEVFKKRAAAAEAERDEARALAQQARDQALEEAAKAVLSHETQHESNTALGKAIGRNMAAAIRALNTAPDRGQDEGGRKLGEDRKTGDIDASTVSAACRAYAATTGDGVRFDGMKAALVAFATITQPEQAATAEVGGDDAR